MTSSLKKTSETKKQSLKTFLRKTEDELTSFYGVTIERPRICFLSSRSEIDRAWNRKTEPWLSAWVKNGTIFILHPQVYTKESNHSADHFWKTLKHEYSHLYYFQKTGINYPKWLNEGLACYLSSQVKKPPTQTESQLIFNHFRKSDWRIYGVGYFWVKLLIEKFGAKKMLLLLNGLNTKITKNLFRKLFYQIYGIDFSPQSFKILYEKHKTE